jgi:uncharacterized surface protein with fasciclin (FAS1) repeats
MDIVADSEAHTILEAAINAAELNETLDTGGPFTLFAPSDDAFAALPEGTVDTLLNDIPELTEILLHHVVNGTAMSTDLNDGDVIETLNGTNVTVTIDGMTYMIDMATVTSANIEASNGVVHVVDMVLLPPPSIMDIVANSEAHTILEAAINAAELNETLDTGGPFTLFAPSDDAFAALPEGTVDALLNDIPELTEILLHHVVNGTAMSTDLNDGDVIETLNGTNVTVTIDGMTYMIDMATVTSANIEASNGVVHVVDMVLLPPPSIMDIVANSEYETYILDAAIIAAGLNETLDTGGPFTLFAPSDDAFGALPEGTVDALLNDIPALTEILLHHVVSGTAMSTDLNDGDVIETLNGTDITVTVDGMTYMIDLATVTSANIEASNGVVHVIDIVLIPTEEPELPSIMDIVAESEAHTTLATAIDAAGLNETLDTEGPFTLFAPTNDAFDALPAGAVEGLLADIPALSEILLHHVVNGTVIAEDLNYGDALITLNGTYLSVIIDGVSYSINTANISTPDIEASNGVVHVIDMVLMPSEQDPLSIMGIVDTSSVHTTLYTAISAAGLNETLATTDSVTLFAPTDDAFAALETLEPGAIAALLDDENTLIDVLSHHVVGGIAMAEDLNDGDLLTTLYGSELTVSIDGSTYMIDMSTVLIPNIGASNGVIHVIDMVLLPPTDDQTVMSIIENSPVHTTLEIAINAAGLAETLSGEGTFTVFAPSDDVFAALPEGALDLILANTELLTNLLLGHVHVGELYSADLIDGLNVTMMNEGDLTVSNDGMTIMIDDATIFQEDLPATNGVVHVIDNILPSTVIDPDTLTVMTIIEASPEHNILEAAINAAGLAETLSGEGPFTVFAPTDDAFDALPAGTVEGLLADIPALTEILLHHVVGATALSTDLNDGDVLTTLNTTELTVSVDDGTYIIDMATVTAANLEADNGVVHVIDMVLIPADPSSINEFNTTDIYMYSLNLLGEKVDRNTKGEVIIDIYTNGKTVKRLNLNK